MRSEFANQALEVAELSHHVFKKAHRKISGWYAQRLGLRGLLLYWFAAPLLVATGVHAATGNVNSMLVGVLASALWLSAAKFNRVAIRENLLAPKHQFTSAGKLWIHPLTLALFSLAIGITAWGLAGHGGLAAIFYGLLAAVGLHLSYPRTNPTHSGNEKTHANLSPTVLASLQEAEKRLMSLRRLGRTIGQVDLGRRLDVIADLGAQVLRRLADHPGLIPRSRKFLHVHLEGAERVAHHYAKTHRLQRRRTLELKFRKTLELIERSFRQHKKDLDSQYLERLDIQISVLQQQLNNHPIG